MTDYKDIEQHIKISEIYYPNDVKTIFQSHFYEIQEHFEYKHKERIERDELKLIFQELGIGISFLPPLDQRGDDGIDNALDGDK